MNWIRRLFKFSSFKQSPEFPNHPNREYWTVEGYEPYSWTSDDIEQAKLAGWENITIQEHDEYPFLAGTVHGHAPFFLHTANGADFKPCFYVPKAKRG